MSIPLHCLAFALRPKFYDSYFLESLAPSGVARRAPNLDREVMKEVMIAFERISEDAQEQEILRKQFGTFTLKKGAYSMQLPKLKLLLWMPLTGGVVMALKHQS